MSDDQRVYSDAEFALILRKATELASRPEQAAPSPAGLTLSEMKAAAAQVGFDPAIVERAARLLTATITASPLERLIGGPLRYNHTARFPITLDESGAARLLSAVRISAGPTGSGIAGHSGAIGMTWQDGGENEALSVTARPDDEGTSVSVLLNRDGTFAMIAVFSAMGMFLAVFMGAVLYRDAPLLGVAATTIAGLGGLALARSYWASTAKKARERISVVMDTIGQILTQSAPAPVPALSAEAEASRPADQH